MTCPCWSRAVEIGPVAGDLDVRFVEEPASARRMPGRPSGVDELRGESLHPPIDSHVVDGDATLGQQFFDVAVGQPVAQIPAHRHGDHLTRNR
jgi:hypothetical protein